MNVKFPKVQYQLNNVDCGISAVAFVISLLFEITPNKVQYDRSKMRHHLIPIFKTMIIDHFPQDQSSKTHKILPLAVALEKRNDALRLRVKKFI